MDKPTAISVLAENIPEVMKEIDHWVLWRYVEVKDDETGEVKWDKPPINPRKAGLASPIDPKTWGTFKQVWKAYEQGGYDGIGFNLHRKPGEKGGLVGIDLDKCVDPSTGVLEPWAIEIVRLFNTYSERSPSGRGVRLFAMGDLPIEGRKKGPYENYETARYLTITGQLLGGFPPAIENRQAEIDATHKKIFGVRKSKSAASYSPRTQVACDLEDSELIRRMCASRKNGAKIKRCSPAPGTGTSPTRSATLGFLNHLAFWTDRDPGRMDQLFRTQRLLPRKVEP